MVKDAFIKKFDTSLIEPDVSDSDLVAFLEQCLKYEEYIAGFAPNLHQLPLTIKLLKNANIDVVGIVGYPLACLPTEIKVKQAKWAVEHGAKQIDMCMELGAFKQGKYEAVERDIEAVVAAVDGKVENISVIPFFAFLTNEEKITAVEIIKKAGATMVKTNPGLMGLETPVEDVKLIKQKFGASIKVMASAGIRTFERAVEMLEAGADRIATSTPFQTFSTLNRLFAR